ncbi:hypothetical protein EVAR_49753_1 [Eumeta japonica]|uniref:Uncharacterized protein n=1 Tax=Eumeta variegata TaxID=151549 RepID=A0A4C1YBB4_EUMVA|nr:hypothetical protein EVAR_49753_1 [Eumeta japonica]
MRQVDKLLSDILIKIGDGCRLNDEERALIESKFFDSEFIETCKELKQVIRLFHINTQVINFLSPVINLFKDDSVSLRSIREPFDYVTSAPRGRYLRVPSKGIVKFELLWTSCKGTVNEPCPRRVGDDGGTAPGTKLKQLRQSDSLNY